MGINFNRKQQQYSNPFRKGPVIDEVRHLKAQIKALECYVGLCDDGPISWGILNRDDKQGLGVDDFNLWSIAGTTTPPSTTGFGNLLIGMDTGSALTESDRNIFLGNFAGNSLSGVNTDDIVIIGYNAGNALTGGEDSVIIGSGAQELGGFSSNSVVLGYRAGRNATNVSSSIIIGEAVVNSASGVINQSILIGNPINPGVGFAPVQSILMGANVGLALTTEHRSTLIGNAVNIHNPGTNDYCSFADMFRAEKADREAYITCPLAQPAVGKMKNHEMSFYRADGDFKVDCQDGGGNITTFNLSSPRMAEVTITAAQMGTLFTSAIEIVAAPAAGFYILPLNATCHLAHGGVSVPGAGVPDDSLRIVSDTVGTPNWQVGAISPIISMGGVITDTIDNIVVSIPDSLIINTRQIDIINSPCFVTTGIPGSGGDPTVPVGVTSTWKVKLWYLIVPV